jgi:4-hydroxybenzoyl-CoA thioesterase
VTFEHRRRVAFGDTDAAGIVYTGRFSSYALEAIEAWFHATIGLSWYEMTADLGIGTPFVHTSLDFRSSLTPRDELLTEVSLTKAGRSSLEFSVIGRVAGSRRLSFEGRFVCVFVNKASAKPIAIPEPFRAAIMGAVRT